ncbi:thiamine pyrophosphate-dependent dehydrogenase E1 component subunit alpha [Emcibacter nanhaiensis]|uniref:Thiamine pyrophosphate-dependent dehydrogenase E1 component subunit alpha n=2 Tax=Emcibacter nanhaiensis TaxID=1505037 RepID=A0A501PJQ3_9PROT|nr:thiamine pyrophosphate-dependent dehydrogenase E1 component subunit alpha [Emcibacter nanhaiensis]
MYETMVKSRQFEEKTAAVYLEGKQPLFNMANGPIPGEMHLSNGQEPVAVGVCAHLRPEDAVTATHRPHHIAIAKGVNFQAMTDEIFGKKSGLSGGRGGHMHLFDAAVNFVCSGIIAEGMGPAVGVALARQMRDEEGIAVAFIGEGAANQGAFHEAMNLAAVWKLPFVCVIEDNSWGISVAKRDATSVPRNDVRAAGYGIPGEYVEGNDPLKIYEAAGRAIARARAGEGPSLLEVETYRLAGHFMGDAEEYRTAEEKKSLEANDPIPKMRARLIEEAIITAEAADDIGIRMMAEVQEAFGRAASARYPAPEEALEKVFV